MKVKTDTVAIDSNSTLEDLFQAFAIRSMPHAGPETYEITKNAYYMGVNATLKLLQSSNSSREFTNKFKEIEKSFELYSNSLLKAR